MKKVISKISAGRDLTKGGVYEVKEIIDGYYLVIGDEGFAVHFKPEKFEDYIGEPTAKKEDYDYINPTHYKKGSKEVYEMMINIWGKEAYIKHCEMCAFKYRLRLGSKPDQPIERDLDKAKWYEDKANSLTDF